MFRNRGITKQLNCQCDLNPDLTPEQEIIGADAGRLGGA